MNKNTSHSDLATDQSQDKLYYSEAMAQLVEQQVASFPVSTKEQERLIRDYFHWQFTAHLWKDASYNEALYPEGYEGLPNFVANPAFCQIKNWDQIEQDIRKGKLQQKDAVKYTEKDSQNYRQALKRTYPVYYGDEDFTEMASEGMLKLYNANLAEIKNMPNNTEEDAINKEIALMRLYVDFVDSNLNHPLWGVCEKYKTEAKEDPNKFVKDFDHQDYYNDPTIIRKIEGCAPATLLGLDVTQAKKIINAIDNGGELESQIKEQIREKHAEYKKNEKVESNGSQKRSNATRMVATLSTIATHIDPTEDIPFSTIRSAERV